MRVSVVESFFLANITNFTSRGDNVTMGFIYLRNFYPKFCQANVIRTHSFLCAVITNPRPQSNRSMAWVKFMLLVQVQYIDVIMNEIASRLTSVSMVYSTVCSGADQRKHKRSVPLALVRGSYRWPMNSPHKGPVTRKIFPLDDVIMV